METYGNIKRAVLELIDQSTIAGEEVPLSYNNQADYVRKIPNLINQAITKIRTTTFPERRTEELILSCEYTKYYRYTLPQNCLSILSGRVFRMTEHGPKNIIGWYSAGDNIMIPKSCCKETTGIFVEFAAYPAQLPSDPDDGYNLSETPEVVQAAEYYAAAMLVMREDEFMYVSLMNEYEARLAAMHPPVTAEIHPIVDVY